jgi:hypothetical protein
MGSINKGWFEEVWVPIHNRDPGDENDWVVVGHTVKYEDIAQEASAIVEERGESYGPPSENHSCTASFWRDYIKRRYNVELPLDAEDVCWFNVLQKISRQAHVRKRDNSVDIIGFVINSDMLD